MLRIARKVHRWLSYIVFIQVSLWILGGLVFAALPFDSLVKGGALVSPPGKTALPANWPGLLEQPAAAAAGPVLRVEATSSAQGDLVMVEGEEKTLWLSAADGREAPGPSAEQITAYASSIYTGHGHHSTTQYVDDTRYRVLGLVDELYGRTGVWQANFDDAFNTRLYFDGATGRYLTVRNDLWVLYDAMWRLHIMDYRGGEDFNNKLLLVFAVLGAAFAISGVVLTWQALRRSTLRRLRPAR
ncbi:hypothetical protein [Haliea sp. E17]|uniref:hypothetical protein n=1 Tax=Haliea sp. E17 TaxID=3401576 RepID=UPI003AACEBD8